MFVAVLNAVPLQWHSEEAMYAHEQIVQAFKDHSKWF
jgi:hypothetical protein